MRPHSETRSAFRWLPVALPSKIRARLRALAVVGFILTVHSSASLADPIPRDVQPPEPQRVAIIIGNGAYAIEDARLPNVDASDVPLVRKLFRDELHFDVVEEMSFADLADFDAKIRVIREKVKPDALVAIYYSGHGFSQNRRTYMVGLDFPDNVPLADVPDFAVPIESLPNIFWRAGAAFVLVVFDGCRTIAFDGLEGQGGVTPVKNPEMDELAQQYVVLFADAQATPVAAGLTPETPSPFTTLFDRHVQAARESQVLDMFKDLSFRAARATRPTRPTFAPSIVFTSLYLQKPVSIREQEQSTWMANMGTSDRTTIEKYYYYNRLSAWAPEARQWLEADRATPVASNWTATNAESISAAWIAKSAGASVAVRRVGVPFGFERTLSDLPPEDAARLSELALLPSGIRRNTTSGAQAIGEGQRAFDLFVLDKFGASAVVLGPDLSVRSAPTATADVVLPQLPSEARVDIAGVVQNNFGDWAQVTYRGAGDSAPVVGYTEIPRSELAKPLELGSAFDEIAVLPKPDYPALVEDSVLEPAIERLRAEGKILVWLYEEGAIDAPADAPQELRDLKEWELRSRFAAVAAFFEQRGISVAKRTSFKIVTDPAEGARGQVIVRIFARAG